MLKKLVAIAALAAIPAAYALAQTTDTSHGNMTMKHGMEMSEADKGYMAAMQTMNDNMMKMEMTGDASADFARMMIPHHQSAIAMAEVLLKQKDADPKVKAMAEKIITDQKREIGELQAWLNEHTE